MNWRLAVNGIQNASIAAGVCIAWVASLEGWSCIAGSGAGMGRLYGSTCVIWNRSGAHLAHPGRVAAVRLIHRD